MLILFDHGTPRSIARWLHGHTVVEAIARGWDRLANGALLKAAEEAGFDLLLSTDKNKRPLAVVRDASGPDVGVEIFFELVVAGHFVQLTVFLWIRSQQRCFCEKKSSTVSATGPNIFRRSWTVPAFEEFVGVRGSWSVQLPKPPLEMASQSVHVIPNRCKFG
jgi:hypothetical protein